MEMGKQSGSCFALQTKKHLGLSESKQNKWVAMLFHKIFISSASGYQFLSWNKRRETNGTFDERPFGNANTTTEKGKIWHNFNIVSINSVYFPASIDSVTSQPGGLWGYRDRKVHSGLFLSQCMQKVDPNQTRKIRTSGRFSCSIWPGWLTFAPPMVRSVQCCLKRILLNRNRAACLDWSLPIFGMTVTFSNQVVHKLLSTTKHVATVTSTPQKGPTLTFRQTASTRPCCASGQSLLSSKHLTL